MPLPDLLDRAAARPTAPPDVERMWRRGRHRRYRLRAATGAGALAVAAAAWLTLPGLLATERPGVTLAPAPDQPPPPATADAPPPAVPEPWEDLPLAEAIERLVAVNETAPDQVRADGTRVTRTLYAYLNTSVANNVATYDWGVGTSEFRLAPDGSGVTGAAVIAEGLDPGTDPERLREIARAADLDSLTGWEQPFAPGAQYAPDVGDLLAEAETLARAAPPSPLPQESETERPPQAAAGIAVTDALRDTVPSAQERIRALRILGGLDPAFVEYRGVVRDLLGREGIGIAVLDTPTASGTGTTLIFSPDTGDLLGEESFPLAPAPGQPELYGLTAILEATVVPT